MRSIRLHLTIAGQAATSAYTTLAGSAVGERPGIQENTFDPRHHQIHFRQVDGNVDLFEGSWSCVDDGGDAAVTFAARLGLGDPGEADPREPLAVRHLVDDTVAQLLGLFPGRVRIDDVVIQAHHPVSAA